MSFFVNNRMLDLYLESNLKLFILRDNRKENRKQLTGI